MLHAVKMHNLKDDDNGEWIVRAIEDYPRYMRLPKVNFVPPVEVDVIWHTHQLSGITYRFVLTICGYVQVDDKTAVVVGMIASNTSAFLFAMTTLNLPKSYVSSDLFFY
jgi:hypothetical protein